ncbi:MAG: DNA alkylation repair protein [Candidatus Aegiribacteria sp.]|nr:DNA alkylation repair protein [Candidatus Aegiribacteria sp.]MBD3295668.1 DNA alkylation repair protein [Candidatus Fermentibacteria bacterium]
MTDTVESVKAELRKLAEPDRAEKHQSFFKTGKGQYGEGDRFLGVRMPHIRKLVRRFRDISMKEQLDLLHSPWHEERMFALVSMVEAFKRGDDSVREGIYELYMKNADFVNNWDLVDVTAPHIPGAWLYKKQRDPLYEFAVQDHLWKRRISIIATQHFIRRDDFGDTLKISAILLGDEHDLIHKAVGWMLREVGKRDMETEEKFLRKHCRKMPRTMLRYAIEKFPEELRQLYLKGQV